MNILELMRRQHVRLANRNAGIDPDVVRIFGAQVVSAAAVSEIVRLPVNTEGLLPLNNEDGEEFFVVGISDPTGVANNHVF